MGIPVVQCSRTYLVVATSLALEYPLLWVLRTLPVHNIVALINIIIPGHVSDGERALISTQLPPPWDHRRNP